MTIDPIPPSDDSTPDPSDLSAELGVVTVLEEQITTLESQLETLQAEAAQHQQAAVRALADLENVKRRQAEERSRWSTMAVQGFLTPLLPRLLELQKGLTHSTDTALTAVVQAFFAQCAEGGLQTITPDPGTPIDPDQHEVLMVAPTGEPGTVAQTLEPGWMYQGTVIIPAKVSGVPLS